MPLGSAANLCATRAKKTRTAAPSPTLDGGRTVPEPSVDCTKAEGYCIAAAGIQDGREFECAAMSPEFGEVKRGEITDSSWLIRCYRVRDDLIIGVELPIQPPGSIDITEGPGESAGLTVYVGRTLGNRFMGERSTNFAVGRVVGTVTDDGHIAANVTAAWTRPTATCESGAAQNHLCSEGLLRMTFRVPVP